MNYEASPRLARAIAAALPLLTTQDDQIARPTSMPAVYRFPLTEAQRLRQHADELDNRDAIILELRAAYKEDRTIASVRDKLAEDAQERRLSQ